MRSIIYLIGDTNSKLHFEIIWNTRMIKSFLSNKDKVQHLSRVIYKDVYSCGGDYIGDTIRNVNIRWNEHESGIECFKYL